MKNILLLSIAAASISFTVAESKLFQSTRSWFKKKCYFLGELVSCGYCFGYWISFVLVIIYQPRLFDVWWVLDYFLTAIVIAWLSGIQWILMCIIMEIGEK